MYLFYRSQVGERHPFKTNKTTIRMVYDVFHPYTDFDINSRKGTLCCRSLLYTREFKAYFLFWLSIDSVKSNSFQWAAESYLYTRVCLTYINNAIHYNLGKRTPLYRPHDLRLGKIMVKNFLRHYIIVTNGANRVWRKGWSLLYAVHR